MPRALEYSERQRVSRPQRDHEVLSSHKEGRGRLRSRWYKASLSSYGRLTQSPTIEHHSRKLDGAWIPLHRNLNRALVLGVAAIALIVLVPRVLAAQEVSAAPPGNSAELCLDGFCIGQSINTARFNKVEWIVPKDSFTKKPCDRVGCRPENEFRGYALDYQRQLPAALSLVYGVGQYNMIEKGNLDVLRHYKYDCDPSARGIFGERRFFGAYRSIPSRYLTVIGLRLIDGDLKVYRIAREYPYHTQAEIVSLAKELHEQYGDKLLLYDFLSSNAYSDVIKQRKEGWFGRSKMFNPSDLSDNAAEFVLIDPHTRPLLQPTSMPDSGEIGPLPVKPVAQCSQSVPLQ